MPALAGRLRRRGTARAGRTRRSDATTVAAPSRAGNARWTRVDRGLLQAPPTGVGGGGQRRPNGCVQVPEPEWDAMGCRTTPGPRPNATSEGRGDAFRAGAERDPPPLGPGGAVRRSPLPRRPHRGSHLTARRSELRRGRRSSAAGGTLPDRYLRGFGIADGIAPDGLSGWEDDACKCGTEVVG